MPKNSNKQVVAPGVIININMAVLAEQQEAKPKKTKQNKKTEGRGRTNSPTEDPSVSSDRSKSPKAKLAKKEALKQTEQEIALLESVMAEMEMKLKKGKEKKAELENESSSDDELPKLKSNGTLDMRFRVSKQIARADGGIDLRFKTSKNAIKAGIACSDGSLVTVEE